MKKLVNFILCIAICLGLVNCVYAQEDNGVAEALKQVKERIDTDEYENFKSSYYKDGGKTSYNFEWSNDGDGYSGLYVTFEDGIIKSYSKYDYDETDNMDVFAVKETDSLQIAKDFIKRINPDIYENLEIVPQNDKSIHSAEYTMDIFRKENGIPVLGQTGYISVSKRTKEVSYFYINYTANINFKAIDNVISEAEAKEAYKKLIPPTLRYKFKRDYKKEEITAYLEYAPKDNSLAINAYDGTAYEMSYVGEIIYDKNMEVAEEAADARGFTPAELEETERVSGLLSEENATETAKKNEIIAIPKGFEREFISLNRDMFNKNEYVYELGFTNDDRYISVSMDAKSGEILSFDNYTYNEKKEKRNRKTEEEKAKKAFLILAGDKASEFRILETEYEGAVRFVRTVNGLDVIGNNAYFDFDVEDNIIAYNVSYTKDIDFPSTNGVISQNDAAEFAFDAVGFELGYAVNAEDKIAQPVYYIGKNAQAQGFMINPFKARLINYNGDDLEGTQKIIYSDIDNHYAKDIFLALADYGIGISGGELKPDEEITQAEYFMLLNKAFGYEADADEIYKRMIRRGILSQEERADKNLLTRENAAIFIIREMDMERVAKHDEIFMPPFTDVTENKGYIAILKAEKIINGDGSGRFYPQNTVTRGEALIMIYNYFAR
ncbi:MAG: S-layer homology domain-containing protein [Firmicutes bacterium]|nr:S-layer homology domain-containing protein [Bacillota bacterium]